MVLPPQGNDTGNANFDSVSAEDVDIGGSDLAETGDVLLIGPSDSAHTRTTSTTSTSYVGDASFQLKRITWDKWRPTGAQTVVYTECFVGTNADVRVQNGPDNETIQKDEGGSTNEVTIGPTNYIPTTTAAQIQMQIQIRSQDGNSTSINDASLETGVQF